MTPITFAPIIVTSNKRRDGSYVVYIRITFKRKSRRLATHYTCLPSDLTRALKIRKNSNIDEKSKELIKRMRTIAEEFSFSELESKDIDWVVTKLKDGLKEQSFSLDFFFWCDKYILEKKESTRRAYQRALNAFERFLGKRQLDINEITKMLLLDFMEFVDAEPRLYYNRKEGKVIELKKQKVAKAASSLFIMKLQTMFQAAKERYNDEDSNLIRIPKSPFSSIKKVFPAGNNSQQPLSHELMQQLILAKPENRCERLALDVFIVSFGLMGANIADMYAAKKFKGNTWIYNRQKTAERRSDKAEVRVDIPKELLPYIKRLQKSQGEWWLSDLHHYKSKRIANACLNRYLTRWQENNGIETFKFYSARHTFGTIARSLGVDLASVNDCLCHTDSLEMGRVYAPLTWEQKNEINKKVIESFVWF